MKNQKMKNQKMKNEKLDLWQLTDDSRKCGIK